MCYVTPGINSTKSHIYLHFLKVDTRISSLSSNWVQIPNEWQPSLYLMNMDTYSPFLEVQFCVYLHSHRETKYNTVQLSVANNLNLRWFFSLDLINRDLMSLLYDYYLGSFFMNGFLTVKVAMANLMSMDTYSPFLEVQFRVYLYNHRETKYNTVQLSVANNLNLRWFSYWTSLTETLCPSCTTII